jgi:AcrR family transcriptional regulator
MLALPEIKMQSDATPQARRRARTAERLREALTRLLRDGSHRLTVAALAREAGVGRNAIYANHSAILDEMRQAATTHGVNSQVERDADHGLEHRRVITELKNQLRQLTTQNAALLKRALGAEANAARLDRRAAQLAREIDEMRRPVPLRVKELT